MLTIYLYDNIIQYKEKEEIKEQPFTYLEYGKITDLNHFKTELEQFLLTKKYLSFFKDKNIKVIIPCSYNEVDKYILNIAFTDLGTYPSYFNEQDLYIINEGELLFNVHNNHLEIISNKVVKEVVINIFKSSILALNYLLKTKKKKEIVIFLGNNEILENYVKEKSDKTLYYYKDPKTYLINQV